MRRGVRLVVPVPTAADAVHRDFALHGTPELRPDAHQLHRIGAHQQLAEDESPKPWNIYDVAAGSGSCTIEAIDERAQRRAAGLLALALASTHPRGSSLCPRAALEAFETVHQSSGLSMSDFGHIRCRQSGRAARLFTFQFLQPWVPVWVPRMARQLQVFESRACGRDPQGAALARDRDRKLRDDTVGLDHIEQVQAFNNSGNEDRHGSVGVLLARYTRIR